MEQRPAPYITGRFKRSSVKDRSAAGEAAGIGPRGPTPVKTSTNAGSTRSSIDASNIDVAFA
jgi:hypothetical protein